MLSHLDATKLLAKYDITLEGTLCPSVEDGVKLVQPDRTYYLKLVSSSEEATHKTEFGYVRRVRSPQELADAWREMEQTAAKAGHGDIGFILQQAREGHEVMIGAKRDPIFGFQVIFTPEGGKYAEICAKAIPPCVRVGRITVEEAAEMVREHVLSARIMGARGEASSDIGSLAGIISGISRLMDENPQVKAIDLNPVFASPEGAYVVDTRIETGDPAITQDIETNRSLLVYPEGFFVCQRKRDRIISGKYFLDTC